MNIKKWTRSLAGVAAAYALVAGAHAYSNNYAQDVQYDSDPSPVDSSTGSSVNQYGYGETNSQIDNYLNQDEQINLSEKSGLVKVLRTNQKSGVNDYVTALIEVKNVNPRELRGMARTICRKEGGDADVLHDKTKGREYVVVVCPEFQLPYLVKTIHAIDENWVAEVNDGSWCYYYEGRNRDVRNMMDILQLYRSPDGTWEFDDANNAVLFFDQPCLQKLVYWGTETVDIPPSQLQLDVAIYEVDVRNDLLMGTDWQALKNGPNSNLFEFIFWDYGEEDVFGLFPGSPGSFSDHGRYRTYDFSLTTAYIDFMQSKGKARLLTRSTLSAKSGTVAELAAVDQVLAFESSSSNTQTSIDGAVPCNLAGIYDYYYGIGSIPYSLSYVLNNAPAAPAAEFILTYLVDLVDADMDSWLNVIEDLSDAITDGDLTRDELENIYLPWGITLAAFHDRTMSYSVQDGRVGVLMSMLPVVGLESAEVALSLDVTDVVDMSSNGLPVIEHRYFSSAVELANGEPLVLGGIKRTREVKSTTGVPYLRDIPWLGYAFGRETTTKRETELIVVLQPRFELCPASEAAPVESMAAAVSLANGADVLDVPQTAFGFDQWLLDPEK